MREGRLVLSVLDIPLFSGSKPVRVWVLSKDVPDMIVVRGAQGKVLQSFVRQ